MFGCGGCLTVAVVTVIAGALFIGRNLKIEQLDVSAKPDPPLTANANQLLPRRVGAFVLQNVTRPGAPKGETSRAWQGIYAAGGRTVTLIVQPTEEARQRRDSGSPFGSAMQRGIRDPNTGVQMSVKTGEKTLQMVVWQKPNWTVMIQSEDGAAGEFARAYRPAGGK
jgi:hypothetical protein